MSNLQKIVNRLESLLDKEEASPQVLRQLEREFERAGMAGTLPTEDVGNFCYNLLATLSELTPLAIGRTKALHLYQTSEELMMDLIPSNHHMD